MIEKACKNSYEGGLFLDGMTHYSYLEQSPSLAWVGFRFEAAILQGFSRQW